MTYEWNFGGGASPNISTEPSTTVTLGRGGTLWERTKLYPARLTVSNEWGSITYPFDLGVTAHWHIELVDPDTAGASVNTIQLKFRGDGTPVIAYQAKLRPVYFSLGPKLAVKEGGEWRYMVPDEEAMLSGYRISLALDSQGNPALAYSQYSPYNLKYAHFNGSSWSIEVVEPVRTESLSFALGPGDLSTVVYVPLGSGTTMFATRDGGGWDIQVLPEYLGGPSLGYAPDGRPSIAGLGYQEGASDREIKYAHRGGTEWLIEPVAEAFASPSLAFADPTPMIAWSGIDLAVRADSGWRVEEVAEGSSPVSLAVDPQGRPAIGHRYAYWPTVTYFDGESWQSEVIEEAQAGSEALSTAFDPDGYVGVAYIRAPIHSSIIEPTFAYLW
ncbi:MAG: hypothetical protein B1H03_01785 [Planctomycetales bacterium 4484_113]|nr:MAG: hypothetical protein B1H03_01785 [Planctomycetales bacterium 4484_113]